MELGFFLFVQAPRRNHPLLLLSGIGTNAIGYDLSPEVYIYIVRFRALGLLFCNAALFVVIYFGAFN